MNWAKDLLKISAITVVLVLLLDFFVGTTVLTTISGSSESEYRVRHPVYHHSLSPNADTSVAKWGDTFYRVCTDGNGFKSHCENIGNAQDTYDFAFIGDSFTEGIGMAYEDSFVGQVATRTHSSVVNLGVASYSPKIYYAKLEQLLSLGMRFEHVIVFVDISDVMDDATSYIYRNGVVFDTFTQDKDQVSEIQGYIDLIKIKAYEFFPLSYHSLKSLRHLFQGGGGVTQNAVAFQGEEVFHLDKSAWTYDLDNPAYGEDGVDGAIAESLDYMTRLSELLKSHKIELSVGVYPWPAQLMHDQIDSRHVQIWKDFCVDRCELFINAYPFFFQELTDLGLKSTYSKYYIPGDLHFNKLGNSVLADLISESIDSL